MTDHAMLGGFRLRVILRGQEVGNVSLACREFGISRATYYKWFARWQQYGPRGLEPHAKRQPQMPNQVSGCRTGDLGLHQRLADPWPSSDRQPARAA